MNIFRKKQNDPGAVSSLRIILEHAGTPLYELDTKDYGKEIIIGRSADCAWTLEGIDSSASSKHAVISKRKNNFYLTDLGSRNGIFFQNKRIKERKLTLGDRISIGECVLQVDMPEVKNRKVTQFHRLEYMDAKGVPDYFTGIVHRESRNRIRRRGNVNNHPAGSGQSQFVFIKRYGFAVDRHGCGTAELE